MYFVMASYVVMTNKKIAKFVKACSLEWYQSCGKGKIVIELKYVD